MGMVLGAERVSAAEGFRLGFVNELVSNDALDDAVDGWCRKILAGAPTAIQASKEAMLLGLGEPDLAAAIASQEEYPAFSRWRRSEDAKEGALAFAERRAPTWEGR